MTKHDEVLVHLLLLNGFGDLVLVPSDQMTVMRDGLLELWWGLATTGSVDGRESLVLSEFCFFSTWRHYSCNEEGGVGF